MIFTIWIKVIASA